MGALTKDWAAMVKRARSIVSGAVRTSKPTQNLADMIDDLESELDKMRAKIELLELANHAENDARIALAIGDIKDRLDALDEAHGLERPFRYQVEALSRRLDKLEGDAPVECEVESPIDVVDAESGEFDRVTEFLAAVERARKKYPRGVTLLSVVDEAGELAHAVNKGQPIGDKLEEACDVAVTAYRFWNGEIDYDLVTYGADQVRAPLELYKQLESATRRGDQKAVNDALDRLHANLIDRVNETMSKHNPKRKRNA